MSASGDESKFVVLHSASTPSQAKVFAALLEGAGIKAHVDGSMLADEFAISQRVMNQQGVKVLVPEDRLHDAREIIAGADISDEELERQAMAAPATQHIAPTSATAVGPRPATIGFALLAFVFMSLWLGASSDAAPSDPLVTTKPGDTSDRVESYWRAEGNLASVRFDKDRNLIAEQVQFFNSAGHRIWTVYDANQNGLNEKTIEHRPDGSSLHWHDDDHDGFNDRCEVRDSNDKLIQQLRFESGRGYVPVER